MKPSILLFALLGVAIGLPAAWVARHHVARHAAHHAPLRVCCMGDSITAGFTTPDMGRANRVGYRRELMGAAKARHWDIRLVGNNSPGGIPMIGQVGFTCQQIQAVVPKALREARPDVILLQAGTNNLGKDRESVPEAARHMDDLLKVIHAAALPGHRLLIRVAGITRVKSPCRISMGDAAAYNAAVAGIVEKYRADGWNIEYVDMPGMSGMTDADICIDGVHPNTAGYRKMARVWGEVMGDVYKGARNEN